MVGPDLEGGGLERRPGRGVVGAGGPRCKSNRWGCVGGVEELRPLGLFSYFGLPLGGARWALLDPEDRTLEPIVGFSERFQALAADGDLVYGVERDSFGVETVGVYRLKPGQGTE